MHRLAWQNANISNSQGMSPEAARISSFAPASSA
jgi:hypothetical protein